MAVTKKQRQRLDPDLRRSQILDAATAVFRENEYSAVSLDLIAEQAGATRGLVHHYFGTKRDLFLAVVEDAVRVPDDLDLIPTGTSGDFSAVVRSSVARWMSMIQAAGGLWLGAASGGAFAETDLDAVMVRARDDLVDRMLDEVPFPGDLDRKLLRSALRCYAATARVATEEWLVHRTLSETETAAFLESTFMAMIETVVPAMADAES
jgi:AcrR family transcriptional regulator